MKKLLSFGNATGWPWKSEADFALPVHPMVIKVWGIETAYHNVNFAPRSSCRHLPPRNHSYSWRNWSIRYPVYAVAGFWQVDADLFHRSESLYNGPLGSQRSPFFLPIRILIKLAIGHCLIDEKHMIDAFLFKDLDLDIAIPWLADPKDYKCVDHVFSFIPRFFDVPNNR